MTAPTSQPPRDPNQPKDWWFKSLYCALKRCETGDHSEPGMAHPEYHKEWDLAIKAAYEDGGFHWKHNIFWKRLDDGPVRVRHFTEFNGCPQWVDWVIPADEWASIVASVSAAGETLETWNAAKQYHGEQP